jgi:hypothetical protein
MASLFVIGFVVFWLTRSALVPADFGRLGFYRAGALPEIQSKAVVFAGRTACLDCHGDTVPDKSVHKNVHCEACHGAMGDHALGNIDPKPKKLNPRLLCLTCHTKLAGRPATFPQIGPTEHYGDGPCTDCHLPHSPKLGGS